MSGPCTFTTKNMKQFIYIFLIIFSLTSTGQTANTGNDFQKLKWLQGSWKGSANNQPFYEGWRLFNDSTLVNFSIEIKDKDTVIKESSALLFRNKKIVLGQETQWQATRITENEIVLKNDTPRFSNTIIWLHTGSDHWLTILEHPKSTVYYDMVRDADLDRKLEQWITDKKNKRN